jgi:hypothetical protein
MRLTLPAILYFIAVILTAHFFPPSGGYHWTRNTISELAAQGHSAGWVMRAGFIGFGLLLAAGMGWKLVSAGRITGPDILIVIYGLAILVTGFCSAAPIDPDVPFSAQEALVHSRFATLAGFALVGAVLWNVLVSDPERRGFHLLFLVLITAISMGFGLADGGSLPVGKGILQRLLYLVSFVWLAAV